MKGVLVRSFQELQRAAIGWSIAVAGVALMYAAFYPSVVIPSILLRAADEGPLAPEPVLPDAYRAKQEPAQ